MTCLLIKVFEIFYFLFMKGFIEVQCAGLEHIICNSS